MRFTLVTWKKIEYTFDAYGSSKSFNGTVFTAPVPGIYSFYVTVRQESGDYGYVYLNRHRNDAKPTTIATGVRAEDAGRHGNIVVQATVLLTKNEFVYVKFEGRLYDLNEFNTTYFEGRLISKTGSPEINA